eukprot:SAG11_NODE_32320_length_284_cov_1.389189_1_plen_36_part_10
MTFHDSEKYIFEQSTSYMIELTWKNTLPCRASSHEI